MSSEQRRREGQAAAKLAYEEGNGLVVLYLAVEHVVELKERVQQLEEDNELLREGYRRTLDIERGERGERIAQLEEALEELRKSFQVRMERAAKLVDEGELNNYWRGSCHALKVCLAKLDVLSSSISETPEKEG